MILARSGVKKMPVSIASQRPAWSPGTMAEKSILIKSGARQSRFATSRPRSMRMPTSSPAPFTNWSGGRVELVDMTSVPGLIRSESFTCATQSAAHAGTASGRAPARISTSPGT